MTSNEFQPFCQEEIDQIIKIDPTNSSRLISRENSSLEFKESFNWNSQDKYAKTIAAFANATGGYIIFGIKNKPKEIVGLNSDKFDEIDGQEVTSFLNSLFSPEIKYDIFSFPVNNKKIGLIYIHEAQHKPIVCIKNSGDIKEADIYYRYRARSEKIKYPELKILLEEEKEKEKRLWMHLLKKISRIGVANVGIFNTLTGEVSGAGGAFLISEDLLPKLCFIREGTFSAIEGSPTLRLVGDVKSINKGLIQPYRNVIKHQVLDAQSIILTFLNQQEVNNPLDYIKQICSETSSYFPVYYFINQGSFSIEDIIKEIQKIISRNKSRDKFIERLKKKDTETFTIGSLISGTKAANEKNEFIKQIKNKSLPEKIESVNLGYFLQAITHLSPGDFDWLYLSPILKDLFENKFSSLPGTRAGEMRKAICHLDKIMYLTKHKLPNS